MKLKSIVILLIVVLLTVGCEDNKTNSIKTEKLNYEGSEYTITVDVPKGSKYSFKKGIVEEANNSYKNAEYTLFGDKLRIEIDEDKTDFTESDFYTKKYGTNTEKNWENYKKYILDDDINHLKQHGIELINVDGIEAVQYKINWDFEDGYDGLLRIVNTDKISKNYMLRIYIFPNNENDKIEDLLKDENVKVILNSLKITKK